MKTERKVIVYEETKSQIQILEQTLKDSPLLFEFFENFESAHTRKCYYRDIKEFLEFIKDHFPVIKDFSQVQRIHTVAFKKWMTELDLAPKTINRKLAANSSFFDFLIEKNILQFNSFHSIRRPKQVVKTPTNDLSDQQVMDLLKAADEQTGSSAPLHRAIIYMLFATGIRKAELINLKLKDIKINQDHHVIDLRTKGGKYQTKVLHPKTFEVTQNYISWMKQQGRDIHPEDWLFQPTRNPKDANLIKPIDPKSIDYVLKQLAKKAGIFIRLSPHSARATYIGSAIDNGVDLYRISQDVGHSSVKTTEEYNKRKRQIKDSPVYSLGFMKKTS